MGVTLDYMAGQLIRKARIAIYKMGEGAVKTRLIALAAASHDDSRTAGLDITQRAMPGILDPRAKTDMVQQSVNLVLNRGIAGGLRGRDSQTALEACLATLLYPPICLRPPVASLSVGPSGPEISCTDGEWEGQGHSPATFTYQWMVDGANVEGATNNTYLVQPEDLDFPILCLVTAHNDDSGTAGITAASNSLTLASGPPPR